MAVIIVTELPSDVTAEDYTKISEIIERKGAPEGLLFHSGFVTGNHIQVVDAWESRDHYNAFRNSQLLPALGLVMGSRLAQISTPPAPAEHEPLDLLMP
jgi:hypothetical protein